MSKHEAQKNATPAAGTDTTDTSAEASTAAWQQTAPAAAPHTTTPKTILLGVSAGIAAYKTCELVRLLKRAGHRVKVVMTEHATELIGPATFRSLTGEPVSIGLYDAPTNPIHHISLADEADLFCIAPATANVLAKLARGLADDLLTTTALTFQGPLLLAPAMNTKMYLDETTQESLRMLAARGARIVPPGTGQLACGDEGIGRMAEPAGLFELISECVQTSTELAGRHVVITAGPTQEFFDPVRYLTNRSSGRMGYALARAALARGARVTLVTGPVHIPPVVDPRCTCVPVVTTEEMRQATFAAAATADFVFCAAAVADYRPRARSLTKIKKYALSSTVPDSVRGDEPVIVELVMNPDILAELGQLRTQANLKAGVVLVGFAAETDKLDEHIRAKLASKGADFIVANDVSQSDIGFESAENEVRILSDGDDVTLPRASKTRIAQGILDLVCTRR
jgi:phosphopantothenoylcysteine decarboxylase/phosphopantothenate--cysteine ligase